MSSPAPSRSAPRRLLAAAARLSKLSPLRPRLAIVLGSGFQGASSRLRVEAEIPFARLPGFPRLSVGGHEGRVMLGFLAGVPVWVLSGRAHYYEGHSMEAVTFPIRMMAELGVRELLLTNAAGGINRRLRPGDLMCLADHINFMGVNPLRGELPPGGDRFVDLSRAYDERLRGLLRQAAKKVKIKLHSGVYLAVAGPSYETPAEIRAFGRLGADAVGMSTVPEVIVARQCGLAVAGLSCITNLAAGRGNAFLTHADVLSSSERVKERAATLLEQFVKLSAAGD